MEIQMDVNGLAAIDPLDTMPPAKKSMVLFFLVDTSKSMEGSKIESLNKVMGEILPELIGVGEAGTDVKIAVMSFASGFEWITEEPVLIENWQTWKDLKAEGVTDLGEACEELSLKLSRHSFLKAPSLSYAPVIFLITDGYVAGAHLYCHLMYFAKLRGEPQRNVTAGYHLFDKLLLCLCAEGAGIVDILPVPAELIVDVGDIGEDTFEGLVDVGGEYFRGGG